MRGVHKKGRREENWRKLRGAYGDEIKMHRVRKEKKQGDGSDWKMCGEHEKRRREENWRKLRGAYGDEIKMHRAHKRKTTQKGFLKEEKGIFDESN